MSHKEIFIDISKVFGVHICAIGITFSNIEQPLKDLSICIAIGYGLWKWRIDYLKTKSDQKHWKK